MLSCKNHVIVAPFLKKPPNDKESKIIKIARILCLFLLFYFPCSITAENGSFPPTVSRQFWEIPKKALPAVVTIETQDSVGSGFFIRNDGYIMTNSHLLENASSIQVITYNRLIFPAQIVSLDLKTDLAVIKIEGSDFPYLTYGNPDELEIGELVFSIGFDSVEVGIVKDKGIDNTGLFLTEDFIKTNAFIYLGNSGGPLLNSKGEVVGINAAAQIDREGNYLGESLAISSKLALEVVAKLRVR